MLVLALSVSFVPWPATPFSLFSSRHVCPVGWAPLLPSLSRASLTAVCSALNHPTTSILPLEHVTGMGLGSHYSLNPPPHTLTLRGLPVNKFSWYHVTWFILIHHCHWRTHLVIPKRKMHASLSERPPCSDAVNSFSCHLSGALEKRERMLPCTSPELFPQMPGASLGHRTESWVDSCQIQPKAAHVYRQFVNLEAPLEGSVDLTWAEQRIGTQLHSVPLLFHLIS